MLCILPLVVCTYIKDKITWRRDKDILAILQAGERNKHHHHMGKFQAAIIMHMNASSSSKQYASKYQFVSLFLYFLWFKHKKKHYDGRIPVRNTFFTSKLGSL